MSTLPRVRASLRRAMPLALAAVFVACGDTTTASPDLDAAFAKTGGAARVNTLTVTVGGLPGGVAPAVRVTGGNGFTATANAGTNSYTGLANGTYTVNASSVTANGTSYTASPATQSVSLRNGASRAVSVNYAAVPTTGTLALTISGLDATPASVNVTGPNGFTRSVTGSQTLSSLAPGSYTVNAAAVTSATGVIYAPTPTTRTVSVTAGVTSSAPVSYAATGVVPGGDFNMQVLATTLTQAVQTTTNSVTLIAGRAAMVRVFPVANVSNTTRPVVRVRVFANGVLQTTLEATTAGTAVPTALDQSSMARSWNVQLPASLVQPGLGIQAVVDPDNTVTESNESDNLFPANGTPLSPVVRVVNPLNLTFVPVAQGTAAPGDITSSNAAAFLADTRDMLPVGTVNWLIRSTYTTSTVLLADGTGWRTVLDEVNALRTLDRSSNHYYGVVKTTYGGGTAGMGFIGAPASIGWDPSWSASNVMAHELGHNFGLQHAPCGSVSGADSRYPYAGGQIGAFGFNVRTNTLMSNTLPDVMGYCDPNWISDYNFTLIMNYRGFSSAALLAAGTTAEQPALLVWGREEPNGDLVLEPAMRVTAVAKLPAVGGNYQVKAYDDAGAPLFAVDFTPVASADDGARGGRHFAFVVPLSDASFERLERLELTGNGRRSERLSRQLPAAAEAAARGLDIAADARERARLRWNANAFPMVMVRDPQSGEVLSFARNGDASVLTTRSDVEVIVSDGVRSRGAVVRVRGR